MGPSGVVETDWAQGPMNPGDARQNAIAARLHERMGLAFAGRGFIISWAVLALLCLPLCILQQVDALLVFSSPVEVSRDLALLLLLCGLPAAVLATLAWLGWHLCRMTRVSAARATALAWGLMLVPVLWLFCWQFARTTWLWVKLVSGHQALISPATRYAVMLSIVVLIAALWRYLNAAALWSELVRKLDGLRLPLVIAVLLSSGMLLVAPPRLARTENALDSTTGTHPTAALGSRPDVIIVTLDALSAQDAQVCGDGPTLMPHLRALAAESLCYTRMYASSNFTTPTTSTLETGALPWTHFATQISAKIAKPLRSQTMAQMLRNAGYRTYTTTDNQLASPRHHGTDIGYMRHAITPSDLLRDRLRASLTIWPDTSLPLLVDSALSFLGAFDSQLHAQRNPFSSTRVLNQIGHYSALDAGKQPAMIWVHSMPPHSPYLPPHETKYRLLPAGELDRWSEFMDENVPYAAAQQVLVDKHRLRYQESIMAVDAAVGDMLDQLRKSGRLEHTLLIISADHGESFEKGFLGHAGPALHEALIRIPLLVRLPGQRVGRVIDRPVSQADLAPSVLAYVGASSLQWADGRSLAGEWLGQSTPAVTPVYAMSLERQSRFHPLRQGHFAIIQEQYKLVLHVPVGQTELFDLRSDPQESNNIAESQPALRDRLLAQLRSQLAAAEVRRQKLGMQ